MASMAQPGLSGMAKIDLGMTPAPKGLGDELVSQLKDTLKRRRKKPKVGDIAAGTPNPMGMMSNSTSLGMDLFPTLGH